ncbi:MAG TPA: FKBP-type peptidyl-prolyl cis-trans isomerase [Euryarchaeota archaeon]|nr:FKBP-type peptidyl-prolyl cis-trans isomerase [archaeon BMS3Bbin15]HDL15520.1 FKBP-type peptidyl-prolyl cis-trans isomerase [Euryarchaeota archaeon]
MFKEDGTRKKFVVLVIISIALVGVFASGIIGNIFGGNSGKTGNASFSNVNNINEPHYNLSGFILIRHDAVNETIYNSLGWLKIYTNSTDIFVYSIHPLANKTLVFNITLLKVERNGTAANVAKNGDLVTINYIGMLPSGKVFDTSLKQVAENKSIPKAYMFRERPSYKPLSFVLGSKRIIEGVGDAVNGMKVNQTIEVTIPPDKAYNYYNKKLLTIIPIEEKIPRETLLKRYVDVPVNQFYHAANLKAGDIFMIPDTNINASVLSINNDTMALELLLKVGDVIHRGLPFNSTVIAVYPKVIEIEYNVKVGQVIHSRGLPWNSTVIGVN